MAVRLNEDKEIVARIKEGLKKMTDIALADWKKQRKTSASVRNLKIR